MGPHCRVGGDTRQRTPSSWRAHHAASETPNPYESALLTITLHPFHHLSSSKAYIRHSYSQKKPENQTKTNKPIHQSHLSPAQIRALLHLCAQHPESNVSKETAVPCLQCPAHYVRTCQVLTRPPKDTGIQSS